MPFPLHHHCRRRSLTFLVDMVRALTIFCRSIAMLALSSLISCRGPDSQPHASNVSTSSTGDTTKADMPSMTPPPIGRYVSQSRFWSSPPFVVSNRVPFMALRVDAEQTYRVDAMSTPYEPFHGRQSGVWQWEAQSHVLLLTPTNTSGDFPFAFRRLRMDSPKHLKWGEWFFLDREND